MPQFAEKSQAPAGELLPLLPVETASNDQEVKEETSRVTSAVDSVRKTVRESLAKVQADLLELRRRIMENPRVARASERATEFVELAREQTEKAVAAFQKNTPADASAALAKASDAVSTLRVEASKVPEMISRHAEEAIARARKTLADASIAVNTWRDTVVSYASQKFMELDSKYQVSKRGIELAGFAAARAKQLNTEYKISEKTTAILSRAQEIDAKYQVTAQALAYAEQAQSLGDRLTGARVTPALAYLRSSCASALGELQVLAQQIEASAESHTKRNVAEQKK